MPAPTGKAPLHAPIAARFDDEQQSVIKGWRDHLNKSTPGLTFSLADALRSLVSLAGEIPEVKATRERS
jgi:hypothetical protein